MIRDQQTDQTWRDQAACRGVDPALFYPTRGDNMEGDEAKQVCYPCPVRLDCLSYALNNNEMFGIWGGTSARQRQKSRRGKQKAAS